MSIVWNCTLAARTYFLRDLSTKKYLQNNSDLAMPRFNKRCSHWRCGRCSHENHGHYGNSCSNCSGPKRAGNSLERQAGDWKCRGCSYISGGANAPKGPTHIKNPKRALENGAFWGLLGPFDPVFLAWIWFNLKQIYTNLKDVRGM